MKIRKVDKSIEQILRGASYLGQGASKQAYFKDNMVIKIPRGKHLIQQNNFNIEFPDTIDDMDEFLSEVDDFEPGLVWPIGQFATEILVWQALLDLESKGLDIGSFARITDYYFDRDNVIVIEQEATTHSEQLYDKFEELREELEKLNVVLQEEYGIYLRDITEDNAGIGTDGRVKLFDFGISETTSLDNYDGCSDSYSY